MGHVPKWEEHHTAQDRLALGGGGAPASPVAQAQARTQHMQEGHSPQEGKLPPMWEGSPWKLEQVDGDVARGLRHDGAVGEVAPP